MMMKKREHLTDPQIEALARLKGYNRLPPIYELEKRYEVDKVLLDKYRDDIEAASVKYRNQLYEDVIRLVKIGAKGSYIMASLEISKTTLDNYKERARDDGLLPKTSRSGVNTRAVHARSQRKAG